MFALPYPREFLGCICLAKTPAAAPLMARELSRLPPLCIQRLSCPGSLAQPVSVPVPRVSPGASSPGCSPRRGAPSPARPGHLAVSRRCG